jgi:epoxyqueuosine reductase
LQRNVCVALGNIGDPVAVPALAKALRSGDALVREHAAWALGRIGGSEAIEALEGALEGEDDDAVAAEIRSSLTELMRRA